MPDDPVEEFFHRLYGHPCWNAKSGYGGFLTMEFGKPSLKVRESRIPRATDSAATARYPARRIVTVRGQWHLWIHSCVWRVVTDGKRIGHSNLKGSSKRPIDRAAQELDGQKLVRVSVHPKSSKTIFEFDLGSRLETRPYDQDSDQWLLFEPSGHVFTLRGDRHYSHQPGNTPPDQTVWKPLLSSDVRDARRDDAAMNVPVP